MANLCGTYVKIGSTTLISPNPCDLVGIFVQSITGSAVTSIVDGSTVVMTFNMPNSVVFIPMNMGFLNNCSIANGGTISAVAVID
jgi:hypothetical protein